METNEPIQRHYARGDLLDAIQAGVLALGKTIDTVTLDDLAPVDEFHIGGRQATRDLLEQFSISANDHVLDVGCGIGGTSRFAAHAFGCKVTGVDLTPEFIETGTTLCQWVGLDHQVRLEHGNVLHLDAPDASFDHAFMLHVGMNLPDKAALAMEIARILKPGGTFGIYDIMDMGSPMSAFPVPWATGPEESWLATPNQYKQALTDAGFDIVAERNRAQFARDFFADLKARVMAAGGPPPLGLPIIMGESAPAKIQNMVENVGQGSIAPVEIVARKR